VVKPSANFTLNRTLPQWQAASNSPEASGGFGIAAPHGWQSRKLFPNLAHRGSDIPPSRVVTLNL
jgi:hypothetical protein